VNFSFHAHVLLLLYLHSPIKLWYLVKKKKEISWDWEILQKIAPMITCDATVTMIQHGKGSQNEIWRVEGSNPSVSQYLCAIYYEQLSSSVPWCYILQALSPLVYYFYYYQSCVKKGGQKRKFRNLLKPVVVGSILWQMRRSIRGVKIWQKLGSKF